MKIRVIINKDWYQKVLGIFLYEKARLSGKPLFNDLLIARRNEMWRVPHSDIHSAHECEYNLFDKNKSISEWKCCKLWQRKLSNKINAKYFAEKLGINVAEMYWFGKNPLEIPFETLPLAYVVKASEGWSSQHVWPIRNSINLFTGKLIVKDDIVCFFNNILSDPKFKNSYIIVEELVLSLENSSLPKDYKLYCFHGHVAYIQVIDRMKKSQMWYSDKWIPIKDQMHASFKQGIVETSPENLHEIISIAEKLSTAYDYKFVRIDLYNSTKGVVFGEFTHTPWVGKSNKLFTPFANISMGKLWQKEN